MITRRFGRTGLDMPVFSCGGMRFQQSWRDTGQAIEPEAQARLAAVVQRGIEQGVVHIETARGYGTSERQLGLLLPSLDRQRLIIQTKVAPTPEPELFREHVAISRRRLGLQRIDLLALHGINTYEKLWWAVRPGGCLAVARQLQAEGQIGHVGFSTHGTPDMICDAIGHEGDGGFDFVNLHWYYIWQHNWPAIAAAAERDMGVFIISPADKGGRLYDPPDRLVDLCAPVHPLVFNALFCLARPEIHTLSIGAARPADFDLALSALGLLGRAGEILPPIEGRLTGALAEVLGPGGYERLFDGVPPWDQIPGYINVRVVIWLRALALAFGMHDYARGRYNLLGNGQDWFPGLSAAAHGGDERLAAAVRASPFAAHIPQWLDEARGLFAGGSVHRLSGD